MILYTYDTRYEIIYMSSVQHYDIIVPTYNIIHIWYQKWLLIYDIIGSELWYYSSNICNHTHMISKDCNCDIIYTLALLYVISYRLLNSIKWDKMISSVTSRAPQCISRTCKFFSSGTFHAWPGCHLRLYAWRNEYMSSSPIPQAAEPAFLDSRSS